MYPITITLHDETQLRAVLNAIGIAVAEGGPTGNPVADGPACPVLETSAGAAPANDDVVTPQAPPAEPESEVAGSPVAGSPVAGSPVAPAYTLDDAKRLTTQVVKAGKRDAMVALLGAFGVAQAVKLPEDRITDFCMKAEALLS